MGRKNPIEVARRETQAELKSAMRRDLKLHQKIDRLKAKLLELRDRELEQEGADDA